ncbi:MAG: dihydrodipicolinate synthase family protein [Streptosporangiaceae bacterium]
MEISEARRRFGGCYVTVPTPFADDDLSVDFDALRAHVNFLIDGGIVTGEGMLLAGGAAGDFATMTFDERVQVASAVVQAASGRVSVAMGAQTTSTLELARLARAAEQAGADLIQVSPPFYFAHTADDFYEYARAAARAADVGLIIYNTFWTSQHVSHALLDRLAGIDNVVALKWSAPDMGNMEFEQTITRYADRFMIVDNQMRFVVSHMLGASSIEVHICNYRPDWGVRLWRLLEAGEYVTAQREMVDVAMPFMALWQEMETWTSGDGYLDKLCMELLGLGSSRCRPPTRDVRQRFHDQALDMLRRTGALPPAGPRGQARPCADDLDNPRREAGASTP